MTDTATVTEAGTDAERSVGRVTAYLEKTVEVAPSSGGFARYLDGVRAVAVLMVFTHHAWALGGRPRVTLFGADVSWAWVTGVYGVDLFFILSGFLLARPWFVAEFTGRPRPSVGVFLRRRARRILPAYYACLIAIPLIFIPLGMVNVPTVTGSLGVWNFLAHLLFLNNLIPLASGEFNGLGSVFWSLNVEVAFYFALPLMVLAFAGKRSRWALPGYFVATLVWMWLCKHSFDPLFAFMAASVDAPTAALTGFQPTEALMRSQLFRHLPGQLFTFALGIGLARLAVRRDYVRTPHTPWWQAPACGGYAFAIGAVVFVTSQYLAGQIFLRPNPDAIWGWYLQHMPADAGLALMFYGVTFGPPTLRRPLETIGLRYLGWISYSVYLVHLPIMALLLRQADFAAIPVQTRVLALFVVAGIITVIVSTVSYMLIERPFLRSGRPSTAAPKPDAPPAALITPDPDPVVGPSPQRDSRPVVESRLSRWMAARFAPDAATLQPVADGIRGVAVVMVVVYHVWALGGHPDFVIGGHSVAFAMGTFIYSLDMFFLLSGYLLARPWFTNAQRGRPRPNLKVFWERRLRRLVPAYYVCLVVIIAVFIPLQILDPATVTGRIGFYNIAAHVTFLHHYFPISAGEFGGLTGSHWSLSLEMTLYILLPVICWLTMARRWRWTIAGSVVVALLWAWLCLHSFDAIIRAMVASVSGPTAAIANVGAEEAVMRGFMSTWVPGYFPTFIMGVLLARMYVTSKSRAPGAQAPWWENSTCAAWAFGFGVVGQLWFVYLVNTASVNPMEFQLFGYYLRHIPSAFTLAAIVYGLTYGPRWLTRPFESLPARFMGWISYSVFLYHLAVIHLFLAKTDVAQMPAMQQFLVLTILTFAVTIPVSIASYKLVERPFMAKRRRAPRTDASDKPTSS